MMGVVPHNSDGPLREALHFSQGQPTLISRYDAGETTRVAGRISVGSTANDFSNVGKKSVHGDNRFA